MTLLPMTSITAASCLVRSNSQRVCAQLAPCPHCSAVGCAHLSNVGWWSRLPGEPSHPLLPASGSNAAWSAASWRCASPDPSSTRRVEGGSSGSGGRNIPASNPGAITPAGRLLAVLARACSQRLGSAACGRAAGDCARRRPPGCPASALTLQAVALPQAGHAGCGAEQGGERTAAARLSAVACSDPGGIRAWSPRQPALCKQQHAFGTQGAGYSRGKPNLLCGLPEPVGNPSSTSSLPILHLQCSASHPCRPGNCPQLRAAPSHSSSRQPWRTGRATMQAQPLVPGAAQHLLALPYRS